MFKKLIPLLVLVAFVASTNAAWAARTDLTVQKLANWRDGFSSGECALTYAAGDASNNNAVRMSGDDLLVICRNEHASAAKTITFVGSAFGIPGATATNRIESIAAGASVAFRPSQVGWKQTDGKFYLNPETNDVKIAVIKLSP